MVLIVAMALLTTGCNGKAENTDGVSASVSSGEEVNAQADGNVLGEGKVVFPFTVVDKDGRETKFEIHTDKSTVGDALAELGLIAGDESEYGLFVKTVNGITADYDTDGVYWAFYVGEDYATESVSATDITDGGHYALQVE